MNSTLAEVIAAGHTFFVFLKDAFPVNCLKAVQNVAEVVRIFWYHPLAASFLSVCRHVLLSLSSQLLFTLL